MTWALVFTEAYDRRASRWLKRHPDLRQQYLKTLQLLEANPYHPSLRLHSLSGRLAGVHSVSINLSYRITLELLIQDEGIIPVNVGDHDAEARPHVVGDDLVAGYRAMAEDAAREQEALAWSEALIGDADHAPR